MMTRLFVLATTLILCIVAVDGAADVNKKQLVPGEPGVCKKDTIVSAPKGIWYEVPQTYKDPKCNYCVKTRMVKKKKVQKTPKTIYLCCKGWKYNEPLNKCEPLCQPDCVNATCVGPDSCECLQGLRRVTNNVCSEPECHPPCQQGSCVLPGVCQCYDGYYKSPQDSFICEPECPTSCINGYCLIPGVCICDEGFVMNNGVCVEVPMCDTPCINAECVGRNQCACLDGYTRLDDSSCKPICQNSCSNGECILPDVCACFAGYIETNVSNICEPACQKPCARGKCVAPDLCECDPGYDQDEEDPYSCKPHCSELCQYGVCISPEKCQCFVGYKFVEHKGTCVPNCLRTCTNGECSAPDTCTCNEGYEIDAEDKFYCKPKCSQDCIHGECVLPDTCKCDEGYGSLMVENICEPKCNDCSNGICIHPNICQCNEGYINEDGNCVPDCQNSCSNGTCEATGECKCDEGFELKNGSCTPNCEGCSNGHCIKPKTCVCKEGTFLQDGDCHQLCTKNLVNALCVDQEKYECMEGFVEGQASDGLFECYSTRDACKNYCQNGTCNDEGICVCSMEFSGTYCNLTNDVILKQDVDKVERSDNCTDCHELAERSTESKSQIQWPWLWVAVGLILLCILIGLTVRYSRKFTAKMKSTEPNFVNTDQRYSNLLVSKPNTLVASDSMTEEVNGSDEVTLQTLNPMGEEANKIVYHELDEILPSTNQEGCEADPDSIKPVPETLDAKEVV